MLRALVFGLIGLFIAGNAMAGSGCGSYNASSGEQQTVMTDKSKPAGQGG